MFSFFFLFSELFNIERLNWLASLLKCSNSKHNAEISYNFFLTGEALYSFLDHRYIKGWKSVFSHPLTRLYVDASELKIIGFNNTHLNESFRSRIEVIDNMDFWTILLKQLIKNPKSQVAFLQFEGPYMSRTSIYALRALEAAAKLNITPELYAYLDGVHLGHNSQEPSAFENIGEKLSTMNIQLQQEGKSLRMLGCSRCGKARGYVKEKQIEGFHDSSDTISQFHLCNLNKIIDKLESKNIYLLASNIAIVTTMEQEYLVPISQGDNDELPPGVTIIITHGPYGSEWCFGGLSFALACANHDIFTSVVFIEDGIFALIGHHEIQESDKIFNIQETISSISDLDSLEIYGHLNSFKNRGVSLSSDIEGVKLINDEKLFEILLKPLLKGFSNHNRIIFF